jgi:hypothetical protein
MFRYDFKLLNWNGRFLLVGLKSHFRVKACKCWSEFDKLRSAKSIFCFCCLLFLLSSGFLNVFQIKLDERRHLGGLPVCLFGFLRPGKREMPDLSCLLGLFKHLKRFQKNVPLTFPVSDLPHGSPVRVFNGSRSWDADSPLKFIGGCKNNG